MAVPGIFLRVAEEPDPITAILTRDWAAIGGWGLFFGLAMLIVIGSFKEWWVPGPRFQRTEDLLTKSVDTVQSLTGQNEKLITANEITKHFFEETSPRRGATPPERVTPSVTVEGTTGGSA